MEGTSTGPLIPRRRLGIALQSLREARGETLQQTSRALMFSPSKLSRIENGKAGEPHPRDVRDLVRYFGLDDTEQGANIHALAEQGRQPGWWQIPPYSVPSRLDIYISYESSATRIDEYAPSLVPGLLQTREYASEILSRLVPWLSPVELALQVDIRMRRQQEYLQRDARPRARYVLTETVLRRVSHSVEAMRDQLGALADICDDPLVDLHVIPFSAGMYEAADLSTTTVFMFDVADDLDVVAIERDRSVEYLEKVEDVRHYRDVIGRMEARWLDRAGSRSFILDVRNSF